MLPPATIKELSGHWLTGHWSLATGLTNQCDGDEDDQEEEDQVYFWTPRGSGHKWFSRFSLLLLHQTETETEKEERRGVVKWSVTAGQW